MLFTSNLSEVFFLSTAELEAWHDHVSTGGPAGFRFSAYWEAQTESFVAPNGRRRKRDCDDMNCYANQVCAVTSYDDGGLKKCKEAIGR